MLKIISVIGTRPEAIKMAPVVKALEQHSDHIHSVVCATAQHREMLDQVLDIFEIRPDYDLDLMRSNQSLSQITARILTAFDEVVLQEKPDWILVQGDTTTAMIASLVGFYHQVKVGHIEAGLRTGDKFQPFPEEINRRIIDVLADLYFVPTTDVAENLYGENVPVEAVINTGNTVVDALLMTVARIAAQDLPGFLPPLNGKRLVLVTAHRRENFGEPLRNICFALKMLAEQYTDELHLVYPVHYNPNVRGPVFELLSDIDNITLIDPVDYKTLVKLMNRAYLVLTDSGGLQEEAPSLDKPVLVLRDITERAEVVREGAAKLVGTDPGKIISEARRLLEDSAAYQAMAQVPNPYGDGQASQRIVAAILNYHS